MLLYGELSILQDSNMVIGSPDHKQLKKRPMLNQNEGIWQLVVKTIVIRNFLM